MLVTLPARDDAAIIALTIEEPFLLIVDNDGKVAIGAAFQTLDPGFLQLLALNDTAVGVVQFCRQGLLEIAVVELGLTPVGVGTGDILRAESALTSRWEMVTYGCLGTHGDLGHLANAISAEVVPFRALNHESLQRNSMSIQHAFAVPGQSYLFILAKAAPAFGFLFSSRHENPRMINASSISLVHYERP